MLASLLLIVFILLGAGVLHYLVGRAPVVAEPYKAAVQWLILVVAVVWVAVLCYRLTMASLG